MASTILLGEAHDGWIGFFLIGMLTMGCWGLAGRWIVLHPDKAFAWLFVSRGSFAARVGHFIGVFMAFFGAMGVIFYLALIMHLASWIVIPAAIACGTYAAIHVRKELHQQTEKTGEHASQAS